MLKHGYKNDTQYSTRSVKEHSALSAVMLIIIDTEAHLQKWYPA
jgi:hypothetical protein